MMWYLASVQHIPSLPPSLPPYLLSTLIYHPTIHPSIYLSPLLLFILNGYVALGTFSKPQFSFSV